MRLSNLVTPLQARKSKTAAREMQRSGHLSGSFPSNIAVGSFAWHVLVPGLSQSLLWIPVLVFHVINVDVLCRFLCIGTLYKPIWRVHV